MNELTFDSISIGRKFKSSSNNIVYKKINQQQAQVLKDNLGNNISSQGKTTSSFFNSPLKFVIVK